MVRMQLRNDGSGIVKMCAAARKSGDGGGGDGAILIALFRLRWCPTRSTCVTFRTFTVAIVNQTEFMVHL